MLASVAAGQVRSRSADERPQELGDARRRTSCPGAVVAGQTEDCGGQEESAAGERPADVRACRISRRSACVRWVRARAGIRRLVGVHRGERGRSTGLGLGAVPRGSGGCPSRRAEREPGGCTRVNAIDESRCGERPCGVVRCRERQSAGPRSGVGCRAGYRRAPWCRCTSWRRRTARRRRASWDRHAARRRRSRRDWRRIGGRTGWFRGRRRCGRRRLRTRHQRRRGQKPEWVVVGVAGACVADAEMKVRGGRRAGAGRSDGADAVAGGHAHARTDRQRGEVQVRGVVAVAGADADDETRGPGSAGEAHLAGRGGHHGSPDGGRDVDPPVLSRCVRVRPVAVRSDHLARDRPDPGGVGGRRQDKEESEDKKESAHAANICAACAATRMRVPDLCGFVTGK